MIEIEHKSIELEKSGQDSIDEYATQLHFAVKDNNLRHIQRLIEDGVLVQSIDKFGRTPLHWALVFGYKKVAYALIINTPTTGLDYQDHHGCTPLHYAALGGRTDVGRILLERGALINAVDSKQRTPLHYAARNARPGMVEMLVSRGANKSCLDFKGYHPCDIALEWGSFSSLGCLRQTCELKTEKELIVREPTHVDFSVVQEKRTMSEDLTLKEDQPIVIKERGPSLDKLMLSWKNIQSKAKLKSDFEAKRTAKASIDLEENLGQWREAEKEVKQRKCQGWSLIQNTPSSCNMGEMESSDGTRLITQSSCQENYSNSERMANAPTAPQVLTNPISLSSMPTMSLLPSLPLDNHQHSPMPNMTVDHDLIYPRLDDSSLISMETSRSSIPRVDVEATTSGIGSNSIWWTPSHASGIQVPQSSSTSLSNLSSPNSTMSTQENAGSQHDNRFYCCRDFPNSCNNCSSNQQSKEEDSILNVDTRKNDVSQWCTEWEIDDPRISTETREAPQQNREVEGLSPPNPCDKSSVVNKGKGKGKEKAFFDEEPVWLQVWPKPSSSSLFSPRS